MASRWRIRHKLLLGLGLAVVLMTLLLGGTLRGLWSYYLTTNRIRARQAELIAVEEARGAIGLLVSDENVPDLANSPSFDRNKYVVEVRKRLDAYGEQLDASIEENVNPHSGEYEKGMLEKMRQELTALKNDIGKWKGKGNAGPNTGDADMKRLVVCLHFKPRLTDGEEQALKAGAPGGKKQAEKELDAVRKKKQEYALRPAWALPGHALDLRNHIKGELDECLTNTRRHYQWALWIVVPSSIVGLLLLLGLMRSFYAWILTPIRDLEEGVERVTAGDLSHRLALTSGDEMEQLGLAFNEMLEQLEALYKDLHKQVHERSRQLVRSERLASVGFLAAGVAHEINNPLASIAFCSEALEARLEALPQALRNPDKAAEEQEVFHKYLKMIQDEAFRCKSITGRLLEFSRTGEPRREMTELKPLIQAVLDVIRHLPNHKGKHIVFEVAAGQPISACVNPEEIKSVVLNLVVNALESMEDGGRLTIRLGSRGGKVELRFSDTGCGMAPEILENIFEPFFTRSRTGKGTGLGLTISHLIVTQHGGELKAESAGPGHGSTFTVRLPSQPGEAQPAPAAPPPPALSRAA